LKAREYIEQQFIPWILFLDTEDTLKHFKEKKEEYLLETYNHISTEFKTVDRYELYMFRVSTNKLMTPYGMMNLIICKTPDVKVMGDSKMLVIAYNNLQTIYYYLEYCFEETYTLKKRTKEIKDSVKTFISPTNEEVLEEIRKDLFK